MELIITLAMKFWMWTVLIALIIIGFIINLFDKKVGTRVNFKYSQFPTMRPIPIKTKGKGFFTMIKMWLLGTRHWEIANDFEYELNGKNLLFRQVLNLMELQYRSFYIHFYHQLECF